jgi:ADP-ribosylglycohydrolase
VIKKIISEGGDTDTNACIVGGLIGSILGFKKLPKEYLKKMLNL